MSHAGCPRKIKNHYTVYCQKFLVIQVLILLYFCDMWSIHGGDRKTSSAEFTVCTIANIFRAILSLFIRNKNLGWDIFAACRNADEWLWAIFVGHRVLWSAFGGFISWEECSSCVFLSMSCNINCNPVLTLALALCVRLDSVPSYDIHGINFVETAPVNWIIHCCGSLSFTVAK